MPLIDLVKPDTLDKIIGHADAVKLLTKLSGSPGWTGDAFTFIGPTGVGKTATAAALCRRFADPFQIHELDGEACTLDAVRDACMDWHYGALVLGPAGNWKAIIVNEAHAMTEKAVQAWLTSLERRPVRRIVCFTTTEGEPFGKFTKPMLGRTKVVNMQPGPGTRIAFADKLVELAATSGKRLEKFIAEAWINKHTGSFRAALQELETWTVLQD